MTLLVSNEKRVYDNVLGAMGNTPLVRLGRIAKDLPVPLYAKLEFMNPGGSVKDRVGAFIIEIDVLLGGRIAELIIFADSSTGAHNDLERATEIARAMVSEYGMGKTLGLATFPRRNQPLFLNRDQLPLTEKEYSEATAAKLDEEIKEILHEREGRVRELLTGRRALLEKISRTLLEREVIDGDEFRHLLAA